MSDIFTAPIKHFYSMFQIPDKRTNAVTNIYHAVIFYHVLLNFEQEIVNNGITINLTLTYTFRSDVNILFIFKASDSRKHCGTVKRPSVIPARHLHNSCKEGLGKMKTS